MTPISLNTVDGISTHALREEGDVHHPFGVPLEEPISTHALREEGDLALLMFFIAKSIFLPTPSARRATREPGYTRVQPPFLPTPSARRATASGEVTPKCALNFYPRPPRGGRLAAGIEAACVP